MKLTRTLFNELVRFCQQDEEHDPSEDFEEYLACAVCGDNCMLISFKHSILSSKANIAVAHRQCARDAGALKSDDGNFANSYSQNSQLT
jgi:hypothetical protein